VRVGVDVEVRVGRAVRVGEGVRVGLGVTGVRVGEAVQVGRGVCVGIKVMVGRGVRVGEAVYVGRGVRLGVRVQVGTGVRVMVGVKDSAAIKVLLCCVCMARAVPVPVSIPAHELDKEPIASGEGVPVPVIKSGSVEVCPGKIVSVGDAMGASVEVQKAEATVGTAVGVLAWLLNGLANTKDPKANSTSAREKASHCLPAAILAWRVR